MPITRDTHSFDLQSSHLSNYAGTHYFPDSYFKLKPLGTACAAHPTELTDTPTVVFYSGFALGAEWARKT